MVEPVDLDAYLNQQYGLMQAWVIIGQYIDDNGDYRLLLEEAPNQLTVTSLGLLAVASESHREDARTWAQQLYEEDED